VVVALIAATALYGTPSPEIRPTACWKALFLDWADGQLGGTYSIACYRTAIAHPGKDRLTYGRASVDLHHALARSVADLPRAQRSRLRPTTLVAPVPEQRNARRLGLNWTAGAAWRVVAASILTALLVAWIIARVRRS